MITFKTWLKWREQIHLNEKDISKILSEHLYIFPASSNYTRNYSFLREVCNNGFSLTEFDFLWNQYIKDSNLGYIVENITVTISHIIFKIRIMKPIEYIRLFAKIQMISSIEFINISHNRKRENIVVGEIKNISISIDGREPAIKKINKYHISKIETLTEREYNLATAK